MRRRLRDVGKTVSGVLGVRLGEAPAEPPAAAADEPGDAAAPVAASAPVEQAQTGNVQTTEAPTAAPEPDSDAPAAGPEPTVAADPVDGPTRPADPVLAAAVEPARQAAREVGGTAVGEHLGVEVEGPADGGPVLTHSFATTDPAYVGWRWAVTLARAEDAETVTVDEVVLLPGSGALLAPAWVPWNERVRPGDLAPGDLLPPAPDDVRLVPAYADPEFGPDAALADAVRFELGLGRARVLSREGRLDAAERWWDSDAGPDSPIAKQAPGRCADCGFLVLLAGGLRSAFGVCANGFAPDDGRVVALTHGCGAHSETSSRRSTPRRPGWRSSVTSWS